MTRGRLLIDVRTARRPGTVNPVDYCAGRVDDVGVTLCQSLNFQLGL